MQKKRIAIIGGGMAGLAAGCYAQMNGFESHIYEMHDIPGGLCTAWQHDGYTFDISIHMLTHSRSGGMYPMWQQLGVLPGRELVDHENAGVTEMEGQRFTFYADVDRLQTELMRIAPEDEIAIRAMIELARKCASIPMDADKPRDLMSLMESLRSLYRSWPIINLWRKYGKMPATEYIKRFKSPLLRKLLLQSVDSSSWPMPDWPAATMLLVLGMRHARNVSYCIGGSFQIAQTIAKRYADLGGTLHLRTRVEKIIVEDDRAVGIRFVDGSVQRADYVIGAADGRTTIWQMLEARYLSEEICRIYREWQVVPPLVQVLFGVNRDLSGEPHSINIPLSAPITVAGRTLNRIDIFQTTFDPTLAPAGKSVVQAWFATDYAYWQKLAPNRSAYDAEKQQIAESVLAVLEERWPGFRAQVEVVDVPTPVTYRRFTGNEQGSPDGWCSTTRNSAFSGFSRLPGLARFYLAGQWTMPFSGVPGAALSGRNAIQYICRDEKQRFVVSLPPAGWTPALARAPELKRGDSARVAQAHDVHAPNAALRVAVDPELCGGCGDCEYEAPRVFAMGEDGKAHVVADTLWPEMAEAVRAALARCPDHAISLTGAPVGSGARPESGK